MSAAIEEAFTEDYNTAVDLFDNNQLAECIEKIKTILQDDAAPRYHQMKSWILLGNVIDSWEDANDCFIRPVPIKISTSARWQLANALIRAEAMWRIVRSGHSVGQYAAVDEALDELRGELDELKKTLDVDRPNGSDVEAAVLKAVKAHDDAVDKDMMLNPEYDENAEARENEHAQQKRKLKPKTKKKT